MRRTPLNRDEVGLYYGMILRGVPAGLVVYALLVLPPRVPIRWGEVALGTAMFGVLLAALAVGARCLRGGTLTRGEVVVHNVLGSATCAVAMWVVRDERASVVPLLFVVILFTPALHERWPLAVSWVSAVAAHLAGSLLAGAPVDAAVAATVVFAVAAAAVQGTVTYLVGRARRLARDSRLERQIAAVAASADGRRAAFRGMLPAAAQLLGVRSCAVVSRTDGGDVADWAVRDAEPSDLPASAFDVDRGVDVGGDDRERLLLCWGAGETPAAGAVDALRPLFGIAVERFAHLAALRRLAQSDGLTGLANRRFLNEILDDYTRRGAPFAVLLMDLDDFKRVNDTLGHLEGDQVLVRTSDALRGASRERDIAARYGGEEFCVVIPDGDLDTVRLLEARLREAWDADRVGAHYSAGLAAGAGDEPALDVLARADAALYDAKREGGARSRVAAGPDAAARTAP